MSKIYRCDGLAGMSKQFLSTLSGYVILNADPATLPLLVHATDAAPPPVNSPPVWDFAVQGGWDRFATAYPALSKKVRLHVFAGETASLAGIEGGDTRFYQDPPPDPALLVGAPAFSAAPMATALKVPPGMTVLRKKPWWRRWWHAFLNWLHIEEN